MSEREKLATALRAHVARRRILGERRTAMAEPQQSSAAEPASPIPSPHPPGEDSRTPRPVTDPVEVSTRPDAPLPADLAPAAEDLEELREAVAGCTACGLCEGRTQTVFADGDGSARVMFVGEAPGYHEDRQGVPFVGAAGQLLTDIITKGMGLRREDVYIANVLKCRPPENRDPTTQEKQLCTAWLDRQIELVDPAVLIPLGRHAANHVLGSESSLGRLRGRAHDLGSRKVVPTYHPAYLLRSPGEKGACWEDIKLAMAELDLHSPPGQA